MKVKYTGRYREPSVSLGGVQFQKDVAVEVTEAWFEACKNPNVKKVVKQRKKVKADDNSNTSH